MSLNRNRLYLLLAAACLAGYAWLYYGFRLDLTNHNQGLELCPIKLLTGIPCPSCGSTRSVLWILQGDFMAATLLNPIGLMVALIMVLAPLWIAFDLLTQKNSLFIFYRKLEKFIQKKAVAIPLIVLVLINWVWNIIKGL